MKALILILLMIGCSKVEKTEIKKKSKSLSTLSTMSDDLKKYSPRIDILVAFLWPASFETASHKEALRKVIQISRDLRTRKQAYLEKRYDLRLAFQDKDCKCLLEGLCDGTETNEDDSICYEIEDALYANDRELPEIYKLVDEIKLNVNLSGGEWIPTHQDFPTVPTPTFDFTNLTINFTAFGSIKTLDGPVPLQYKVDEVESFQDSFYQTISFKLIRQEKGGELHFELTPTFHRASLLFQGDLTWIKDGEKREGIVYWEHERPE